MLGVVRGLGVEGMVGHSVALDEGTLGRRVRDGSEHCSGGGGCGGFRDFFWGGGYLVLC